MDIALHKATLSRHALRYLPEASDMVVKHKGAAVLMAQHVFGRSPNAHAALLSALFCHLRVEPHEQPVKDFKEELAVCLKKRKVENVLEVGPGSFPFWDYLQPLAPLVRFFGLGLGPPPGGTTLQGFGY
jgi:hypothetical protein